MAESHKCVPQNPRETASLLCHAMPICNRGRDILERTLRFHGCARYTDNKKSELCTSGGALYKNVVCRCSLLTVDDH